MDAQPSCLRCGRETPRGARFCPSCGAELQLARPRVATGLLAANMLLNNRYMVLHRIAQGGQSAVYLALDTLEDNTERAIKEMSEANLSPEEREKAINDFIREANMLTRLNHPALAKVYNTFVDGHKHYLVMEFVKGHNLEDELVETGHPLEWDRVAGWGIALCDVLSYLHAQNPPIIYRDLKPANVMLVPDGSIKLVDFGIARWLHPARTRDTAQLGTDGYAPLEQYSARSEARSDLYALGASLYHLLTGRVPESAPSRLAGQRLTPVRVINQRVPEPLEQIVMQALSLQSRDRYPSAAVMREALERAVHPESVRRRTTMVPSPASGRLGAAAASTNGAHSNGRNSIDSTPARLYVWPLRLDAGYLDPDDTALHVLDIANRGGGKLTGTTETNMHCLKVDPVRIDETVAMLQVHVDTRGLHPGPYTCHLAVRTNGGSQIIPVRFVVRHGKAASGSAPRSGAL